MKIEKDKWVVIDYTLKGEDGNVIDSSIGIEPLEYLHGYGMLITGLEKELEGKETGDKFTTIIQPAEGYGDFDESLVMDVPKDRFEGIDTIEVGMNFQVATPQGPVIVKIAEIKDDVITVDGNHELAGKVLNFEVEVKEVREPTEEELGIKDGCGCSCGGGCGSCDGDCECDGNCGEN